MLGLAGGTTFTSPTRSTPNKQSNKSSPSDLINGCYKRVDKEVIPAIENFLSLEKINMLTHSNSLTAQDKRNIKELKSQLEEIIYSDSNKTLVKASNGDGRHVHLDKLNKIQNALNTFCNYRFPSGTKFAVTFAIVFTLIVLAIAALIAVAVIGNKPIALAPFFSAIFLFTASAGVVLFSAFHLMGIRYTELGTRRYNLLSHLENKMSLKDGDINSDISDEINAAIDSIKEQKNYHI